MQEKATDTDLPHKSSNDELDVSFPNINLTKIAFGSCHSRGAFDKHFAADPGKSTIWNTIAEVVRPQTFLWTGDAVYPPMEVKGNYPLDVLKNEFHQMKTNATLGYAGFIQNKMLEAGVHGTWDDHDYGGNDRGDELRGKEERRDAYLDFLGVERSNNTRQGVYNTIEFGTGMNKVKIIFLDTRYNRSKHCIPSVGAHPYIPHGAIFACLTRWITAGFNLCKNDGDVLGEEQWSWLEKQLSESSASMHIIVSSIQVLTTNPVVESFGHFPEERDRLLKMVNTVSGLILLSGDVHHAEISSTNIKSEDIPANEGSIIEVTSSGMTHSCNGGWYGRMCQPILNRFEKHRFLGGNVASNTAPSYFTQKNFGSISIDWEEREFHVDVHNELGEVILHVGPLEMNVAANLSASELAAVDRCIDGHFLVYLQKNMTTIVGAILIGLVFQYFFRKRRPRKCIKHD